MSYGEYSLQIIEELEKVLPRYHMNMVLEKVGAENVDWILDNHHLFSTTEIAHKCGIGRKSVIQFFHVCGISTEYVYSADYTTPRVQGELAGRARECGYKVEGLTITRGSRFSLYLEHQAVGVGYQVFDEFGNKMLYPEVNRPKVLATEYSNAIDLSPIEDKAPRRVKAVTKVKVRGEVLRVAKVGKRKLRQIVEKKEKEARPRHRKGYMYQETYNKGHGVIAQRFVGEIMVNHHRHRFRSTNSLNVERWLDEMVKQHLEY